MADFAPVTKDEVAAVLRAAKLREALPAPGWAPAGRTRGPGFWLVQDGDDKVLVHWNGRYERYRTERLDRCRDALEAAGMTAHGFADAPRFWLEVFRRAPEGGHR
jgi:hypothetical protein